MCKCSRYKPFIFGGIITSLAYALGLVDELLSIGHFMMPTQLLDVKYCHDSHLVSPRQDGRGFTLMVNKHLVPSVILPCPNRINVRNNNHWHFDLNAPAPQPQPEIPQPTAQPPPE